MGWDFDQESGGDIHENMQKNIQYCVREKLSKIEKVRHKYHQWWLALVDHIGLGLDDDEREMIRRKLCIDHDFDKILVIDPNDPTSWFEI